VASPSDKNEREETRPEVSDTDELMIWPGRLAADTDGETVRAVLKRRRWDQKSEVAKAWHVTRSEAQWQELGAVDCGIERNRIFELLGCMSSISERFGLAIAAGNEVALWEQRRAQLGSDRGDQAAHEMCQRAMGEHFAYYLLGTGHGLAAVVLRTLALDDVLRPRLLDVLGASCVIDSGDPLDWPALNTDTCRKLRRVARDSTRPAMQAVVEPITTITQSSLWGELDAIRGEAYHRRRPQTSLVDGVPLGSAWRFGPNGAATLALGTARPTERDDYTAKTIEVMHQVEQVLVEQLPALLTHIGAVRSDLTAKRRNRATAVATPGVAPQDSPT
jgi:hypothetical protein